MSTDITRQLPNDEYQAATVKFLKDEPYATWWLKNQSQFPPEYSKEVNRILEAGGT